MFMLLLLVVAAPTTLLARETGSSSSLEATDLSDEDLELAKEKTLSRLEQKCFMFLSQSINSVPTSQKGIVAITLLPERFTCFTCQPTLVSEEYDMTVEDAGGDGFIVVITMPESDNVFTFNITADGKGSQLEVVGSDEMLMVGDFVKNNATSEKAAAKQKARAEKSISKGIFFIQPSLKDLF